MTTDETSACPAARARPTRITRGDLVRLLATDQADRQLTADLAALGGETTDDLDWPGDRQHEGGR
ncbi:MAG: hypothetical protein M9891_16505 [Austwickia sp.]|nr:hypothetical protein [Actinomycetota bacterium]MCB1253341.1 hypothetical protein [Austwickia sp.]MCO5310854.1 hypothetical protein [Austwickia sp.]